MYDSRDPPIGRNAMTPEKIPKGSIRVTRPARGRVPGDGLELAFGYWPGRGAPVVALHGLTASHMNFVGIAERLAGRYALFALDLRGRGDSDKPTGPYGFVQHARDVAAAMRAMGLGASIITGHSMGAFVATALAAQEPSLVSGLVLIDGGLVPDTPTADSTGQGIPAALALRITQLRQTYPHARAIASSGERNRIFPSKNGIRGWSLFWTMKSAAIHPCSRKLQKRECLPICGKLFSRKRSTSG